MSATIVEQKGVKKQPKQPVILIKHLDWVYKQPLSASCKAVLLNLVRRADRNGECFPSIELICTDTSTNRKTVMQAIRILEARNLIAVARTKVLGKRQGRSGIKNRYTLQYEHTLSTKDQSTRNGTLMDATKVPKLGLCSATTKVPFLRDQSTEIGTVRKTRRRAARMESLTTLSQNADFEPEKTSEIFRPEPDLSAPASTTSGGLPNG